MRYPKRIANLAHISFTAIFHHACPADDFEIGDLRQLVKMSSCTPSANAACSFSSPRFSNGRTAIPVVTGCRINSLFQTIQPAAAAKATRQAASSALLGLRHTHFLLRPMIPVCRAKIGSCFSQRSKSSASARAEEYRRFGSFSGHFKQIVERSRSIFGFNRRGGRGSVSKRSL